MMGSIRPLTHRLLACDVAHEGRSGSSSSSSTTTTTRMVHLNSSSLIGCSGCHPPASNRVSVRIARNSQRQRSLGSSQLWRSGRKRKQLSWSFRTLTGLKRHKMSHQTGIKANDALKKIFAKCRDGKIRVLKVSIENEELAPSASSKVSGKWQDDYNKMVKPLIVENQPAYILYRLDTKSPDSGYDWLFISWSPDTAPIRQKMLYASTKATLKQEFGTACIKDELHGTVPEDITLDGYHRHKRNDAAPVPLTSAEEELVELKKTTINTDYSVETRHQTLSGVAFPVTDEAKTAITDLGKGIHEYIQLKIDLEEEKIHLVLACEVSLDKLPTKVPSDSARYHLYNFKHTHEGDYMECIVFIYSMPGYSCSIKERMLYSSCKAPLLDLIQSLGVNIAKKLEIDDGKELTEGFLQEELHPKVNLHRPKFAKPKGPPSRGAKRITKLQDVETSGQEA